MNRRRVGVVTALLAPVGVGVGILADAPAAGASGGALVGAAVVSVAAVRSAARRTVRRADARAVEAAAPEALRRYSALLEGPSVSWASVERVLRPVFRPLAFAGLAARGIDLAGDSERARAVLGDELWAVVGDEPRSATDARSGELSRVALGAMIERLEALSAADGR